jgi:hypothetical protein
MIYITYVFLSSRLTKKRGARRVKVKAILFSREQYLMCVCVCVCVCGTEMVKQTVAST